MTSENFFKEAGKNFVDNLPDRIKILGPIEDADPVKYDQIVSKKSHDGYEYRLAVNCKIPGLDGSRNLMVRTREIKQEYRIHGVKHLADTVNPQTNQVSIAKGSYTFCVV